MAYRVTIVRPDSEDTAEHGSLDDARRDLARRWAGASLFGVIVDRRTDSVRAVRMGETVGDQWRAQGRAVSGGSR